jgi:hypothetical protein
VDVHRFRQCQNATINFKGVCFHLHHFSFRSLHNFEKFEQAQFHGLGEVRWMRNQSDNEDFSGTNRVSDH